MAGGGGDVVGAPPGVTRRPLSPPQLRDVYGPVFTVYLGTRRVVVLCGHAAVREALVEHAEEFAGRGRMPTVEKTFNGHGEGLGGVTNAPPVWGHPPPVGTSRCGDTPPVASPLPRVYPSHGDIPPR